VVKRGAIVPVVGIPLSYLKRFLGKDLQAGELIDIFHEIGISVDAVDTAVRFVCSSCGEISEALAPAQPLQCENCRRDFVKENADYKRLDPVEMFRLELLANRPDNFDAPGIARSIRGYLGIDKGLAAYGVKKSDYEVTVDPRLSSPGSYRPRIAAAVVTGVTLDEETVKSVMKLQENLHWALGRNRKFAAIGLYDLATIGKKIHYRAMADDEISFVPLACGGSVIDCAVSPKEILVQHAKGKAFAYLLEGFDRFPLLIDDGGVVLSMPPIINSQQTRVTKSTKGFFIDVTGFTQSTVEKVLSIIVTSLKDAMPSCELNAVNVRFPDGETIVTPQLEPETFTLDYGRCAALVGCEMAKETVIDCLKRMRFDAVDKGNHCDVIAPAYRADIRHEQDLIEDVAIAYGYGNLKPQQIGSFTAGMVLPAEAKKQQLREAMVSMGFLEIVTIMLTSEQRQFGALGMATPENRVIIDNPISTDQTMVRTELMAGLLEIIAANTSNELPQRLFETGEVAHVNAQGGVDESVALCAAVVDSKAGFSDIKAVLKNIMHEVGCEWKLEARDYPFYLGGRSAAINVGGVYVGHVGEVYPGVLDNFKISNPTAVFELDLLKMGIIGG